MTDFQEDLDDILKDAQTFINAALVLVAVDPIASQERTILTLRLTLVHAEVQKIRNSLQRGEGE